MEKLLQEMGLRIAVRRKELNLTQEALANLADVTAQTISSAECGRKALRPENIVKISTALKCSTDYLLLGKPIASYPKIPRYENLLPQQKQYLDQIIECYLLGVGMYQN